MTDINRHSTVGNWVAAYPETSRVFEDLRIDYCCGGGAPLEQACQEHRLDIQHVLQQLDLAINAADESTNENWLESSLSELCDNIEETHHAYLKAELPRLTDVIAKVVAAHSQNQPQLPQVQQVFAALRAELEPHMFKEERILFPAIRHMEQSAAVTASPFGTLANPIRMMEQEHDHAGDALQRLHALTSNYQVPEGACNTYRAMLARLRQLEQDMHQHVHKENNILFPRAIAFETQRAGSAGVN